MLGRAACSCSRSGRRTMGVCADFWPEQWQDDRDTQSSRICTRCRQETQLRSAAKKTFLHLPFSPSSFFYVFWHLWRSSLQTSTLNNPKFGAVQISPLFSQRWLNQISKIICRKLQKLLLTDFCQFLISSQCKNKWRHIY